MESLVWGTATPGLAGSRSVGDRGGPGGGGPGVVEDAGSRPAGVRHARAARAAAVYVRDPDGAALSDVRHDHGLCLVRAGADRSVVARQPGGLRARGRVAPLDDLAARLRGPGRAGRFRSLSGPADGARCWRAAVLGLASLVDPMDRFAGRPDRRGSPAPRRGRGVRPETDLPIQGRRGLRMTPRTLANARVRLALVALLAGGSLLAISGCDPRTLAYFLQPFDPTVAAAVRDVVPGQEGRDPLPRGRRLHRANTRRWSAT